ncbi:choice-of-anchor Q domain-containing protein [Paludisphaera mucosa]|uniref:Probable pectate lyase C n=1 Tax=Paludisphaera mucosa TaxID=3030827 RepID=A0ABT6FLF4_9BACT|nr:choice-of-anchor Q domain-containing protein [Paludisphaera mucosa]MDG3008412.1 choice-of-anchor Q domain-containing protein [Paludisphaera mucosa]
MRPTLTALEDRKLLSTFTVTNTLDDGSDGSLRWAIGQANANSGPDTIDFSNLFDTPQTIPLGGTELSLADTTGATRIDGPAPGVTIDGGWMSGVFRIEPSAAASLSNLRITGGMNIGGAGVLNAGTLTMTDCTISGNQSTFWGGAGLSNAGTATLMGCTISDNSAYAFIYGGGGVYNNFGSTLSLTNCTVSGNSVTGRRQGTGTGLYSLYGGTLSLTNCTVSGNADSGVVIRGSTTTAVNTIIAGNGYDSTDLVGPLTPASTNNLIAVDARLAPLGDYGGPTRTMPLLPGSPAIDAGTTAGAPATDQRGVARVGGVDVGAFESRGFTIVATSGGGQTSGGAFAAPLVATVAANDPTEPVAGGLVTFSSPTPGPGAIFSGNPATIGVDGTASATASSNFIGGSYFVTAVAAGVSGTASFELTNDGLVSIKVVASVADPTLALGVSGRFSAVGVFADGSTVDLTNSVTWASADVSVAAIGADGLATALAVGSTGITASFVGITSPADVLSVIAPSYVVDTADDSFGFYDGTTSLREALAGANAAAGGQAITFDAAAFATARTIVLALGRLEFSDASGATTIAGPAAGLTIDAAGAGRVFQVDESAGAYLDGLTITGGREAAGGGVLNLGALTMVDCTISGNSTFNGSGGGLLNASGAATLIGCTITGNNAAVYFMYGYGGGGVMNQNGTLSLTNCTIAGNSVSGFGGSGGGLNSLNGTATLINCTVAGNFSGGVVINDATATAVNTIIAGNDYNLSGSLDPASTNNLIAVDARLAPLGDYGGPTRTMPLLPGSPAIDAGTTAGAPATDQRGVARVGGVDVGAFESRGFTIVATSGGGQTSGGAFAAPLVATVAANDPTEPVAGGLVTFSSPTPGPGAIFSGNPATIGVDGTASATASSNFIGGSYFVTAVAAGVSGTASFELTNDGLVSIKVVASVADPTLALGVSGRFSAVGVFADGSTVDLTNSVTWASADVSVAAIGADGLATALAVGSTGITASFVGITSPADVLSVIAPSYVVDTADDSFGFYDGTTSLREALAGANAAAGGQAITFDAAAFATARTIVLALGRLEFSDASGATTIAGPAAGLTIDAAGAGRVFQVDESAGAYLDGLTITGGREAAGGGVLNLGALTMVDCTISGNSTFNGSGGGLLNASGAATLIGCTITGNDSTVYSYGVGGGGVMNYRGTLAMTDCTISGNSASGWAWGGGLTSLYGTATLTDCVVNDNSGDGVVIIADASGSDGSAALTDCTISGNSGRGLSNSSGTVAAVGVTINGNGGSGLSNDSGKVTAIDCTISGNSGGVLTSGFYGGYFGTTTLTGCLISGNASSSSGGGVATSAYGTTNLTNCTVAGNASSSSGGGLCTTGASAVTNLTDCTVSGNTASSSGGGIATTARGTTNLTNCTVAGNAASFNGGGVVTVGVSAVTNLTDCTVSGNVAGNGGGGLATASRGAILAVNTTIAGNAAATFGGGAWSSGALPTLRLINCTVSGNSAGASGGGLYSTFSGVAGTMALTNTIVAGNTGPDGAPSDIKGNAPVSGVNNLIGVGGSGGLIDGIDGNLVDVAMALLAPLGDYGGPTQTMPLLPGGPGLDAGTSTGAPTTDQRGLGRVGGVDIGAFESQGFKIAPIAGATPQTSLVDTPFGNPLAVSVTALNSVEPVDGGMIRFLNVSNGHGRNAVTLSSEFAVVADGRASVTATAGDSAGPATVRAFPGGENGSARFDLTIVADMVAGVSVGWGTQTAGLVTAPDGVQLLPVGRKSTIDWAGIKSISVTIAGGGSVSASDVVVKGVNVADYGPVTVIDLGGGTFLVTLARPINEADRVTITISNPTIGTYTRRLDVLPGDINDDGTVNAADVNFMKSYLAGQPNVLGGIDPVFFDLNGDGIVTSADYLVLTKAIGKKKTKLP